MTDTENTSEARKPRTKNAPPAASGDAAAPTAPAAVPASAEYTVPATPAPAPARGPGRGILIGAIAATLVGGLGIGGVGGFALATAVEHHAPAFAGHARQGEDRGPRDDRPGAGEQGERPGDGHGMPGQPPQSGTGTAPNTGTAPAPGTTESPDSGGQ
jgi:hypothetical protein